jgi:MraZ protein
LSRLEAGKFFGEEPVERQQMFRGSYEVKVDDKGRFKLPAGFVKVAEQKQYGSEFFLTSFDGLIGEIWPLKEWEQKEADWAVISDESRQKREVLQYVNYYGQQAEMDGQFRLLVHPRLRSAAKLLGDVDILGAGKYMKIANADVMRRLIEGEGSKTPEAPISITEALDFMAEQVKLAEQLKSGRS